MHRRPNAAGLSPRAARAGGPLRGPCACAGGRLHAISCETGPTRNDDASTQEDSATRVTVLLDASRLLTVNKTHGAARGSFRAPRARAAAGRVRAAPPG